VYGVALAHADTVIATSDIAQTFPIFIFIFIFSNSAVIVHWCRLVRNGRVQPWDSEPQADVGR